MKQGYITLSRVQKRVLGIVAILSVGLCLGLNAQTITFKGKSYHYGNDSLWMSLMDHSVSFVVGRAYDPESGAFFSEIGPDGNLESQKIHLLALSRMIYALSVSSTYFPEHLPKAETAANFIRNQLVTQDSIGPYFFATYDKADGALIEDILIVNEQTYGLCGLISLYKVNQDPQLAAFIHKMYKAIDKRFYDEVNGGYFEKYSRKTSKTFKKSYNSTIYVISSALLALHQTFPENTLYKNRLETLINIVTSNHWDVKTGWLIEEFSDDWKEAWEDKKKGSNTFSEVGHTAQVAWLLLRISQLETINSKLRQTSKELAKVIMITLYSKPTWDKENGGVFGTFSRENNKEMGNGNKAWWQQAEVILAYQMAYSLDVINKETHHHMVIKNLDFFFNHFVDEDGGGEFFNVSKVGDPITGEPKGNKGKSAYHTTELAEFMIEYIK